MSKDAGEVISGVVRRNLCVGCGVCAGICPNNVLQMRHNAYGEYNPHFVGVCRECGYCLKHCPFADGNPNEDMLAERLFAGAEAAKYVADCGFYTSTYVGYSRVHDHRAKGASGGLATWFLEELLRSGSVDGVITVRPNFERDELFRFDIVSRPEDLRMCARSCYYPVNISRELKRLQHEDGVFAVVGLPCLIKALRLACETNKILKSRIRFFVGLVCSQNKSCFFTEYLIRKCGCDPSLVTAVSYRDKEGSTHAGNPMFTCVQEASGLSSCGRLPREGGWATAWDEGYFTLNACNWCDDVYAELADVTFMDAWLPDYACDPQGTSLVISRRAEISELFTSGMRNGHISLDDIPVERIVDSQRTVLHMKREMLGIRLRARYGMRNRPPRKRIPPSNRRAVMEVVGEFLRIHRQVASKRAWAVSGGSVTLFEQRLRRTFTLCLFSALHSAVQRVMNIKVYIKRVLSHCERAGG